MTESDSAMKTEDPFLLVSELEAGHGDIQAIWGISFGAAQGSVTLLLGRNGAGKTTTLQAIAGLVPVWRGSVQIGGTEFKNLSAYRRARSGIGFVQEGKRIFADRTVEENILLGTSSRKLSHRARREVVDREMGRFPILAARRGNKAGALSGGQQQMLAIAGALAGDPKLLLLDEPSAGLAPAIVEDVLTVVKTLCRDGLAVVLVEQNAERALTIADRVVVLDLGRVVVDVPSSTADVDVLVRAAYFSSEAQKD